jgi:hypothetical protein
MAFKKQYYKCEFCNEDQEDFLREERKLEGVKPFIVCEECDCSSHSDNYNGWANNHYWCECDKECFIKKTEDNKVKWGIVKPTINSSNPHHIYVCKECAYQE